MKEKLLSRGFIYVGTGCSCNGSPAVYQIPAIHNFRVEILANGWWIKQKINHVTWSGIIGGGDSDNLEENLNKYFKI